tara:strand:- start:2809 stop:2946 length:138 start_codon:yes stop_codon:yes gene_type:complete
MPSEKTVLTVPGAKPNKSFVVSLRKVEDIEQFVDGVIHSETGCQK